MIVVEIAGERCAISGPEFVADALRARYRGFVVDAPPSCRLRVDVAPGFRGDYAEPAQLELRLEGERLCLHGCARGQIDVGRGEGELSGVADLGPIDAALRALVAARAPLRGTLLLHGMIAPLDRGALVLLGRSGDGKSTAAQVLDAASDEIVAIDSEGRRAGSTPYWGGRPFSAGLAAIGVLTRGRGRVVPMRGAAAVRLLSPHVVRYALHADAERAILAGLAALATRTVWSIEAPEGRAFPPFVRELPARLGCNEAIVEVTP